MDNKLETIRNKDLQSVKKIRRAFSRANSLALSVLVEVISRGNRGNSGGLTEKQACLLLNINYKLFRYWLDSGDPIATNRVKHQLGRARDYRSTIKREKTIRSISRTVSRLIE